MARRRTRASGAVVGAAVLGLASCAAPTRLPAVPLALQDQAVLLDNPAIRSWEDPLSPAFEAELESAVSRGIRQATSTSGRLLDEQVDFLAISGGGQNGAFAAGLLCGWTTRGDRPEFEVVTGISTGALLAPLAFLGPDYDDEMRRLYTTVNTRQIATRRPIISGLLGDSLADAVPLRNLMGDVLDEAMMSAIAHEYGRGRILAIATTNLDADRAVIWNIGAIAATRHPDARQLVLDVLLASASIPAAFPPVMIDVEIDGEMHQEMHVDGGVKAQTFVYPPSLDPRRVSAEVQRERTVYVIRNARIARSWASVRRRSLSIAARSISSLIHANGIGDLLRIYVTAQRDGMAFRLAYIPEEFDKVAQEEFDPEFMNALFDLGFDLASGPDGYPWATEPPGWRGVPEALFIGELPHSGGALEGR